MNRRQVDDVEAKLGEPRQSRRRRRRTFRVECRRRGAVVDGIGAICDRGNISYHAANRARSRSTVITSSRRKRSRSAGRKCSSHQREKSSSSARWMRVLDRGIAPVVEHLAVMQERRACGTESRAARRRREQAAAPSISSTGDVLSRRDFFLELRAPRPEAIGPRFDGEASTTNAIDSEIRRTSDRCRSRTRIGATDQSASSGPLIERARPSESCPSLMSRRRPRQRRRRCA